MSTGVHCDICNQVIVRRGTIGIRLRYWDISWPDGVRHLHYHVRCWDEMHTFWHREKSAKTNG